MNVKQDLSCFQSSYAAARARFLQCISAVPSELIRLHESYLHPLAGPDGAALDLDWLQLGQRDTPERILVLIVGTHGIEGYTGSAIVCNQLCDLSKQLQQDAELGVVIIHALNPWGFAWQRRYDHEGIDLNRNFIDFTGPLPADANYDRLHEQLFKDTGVSLKALATAWNQRWGAHHFEETITTGQYQHADGLFYGGRDHSWSRKVLTQASDTPFLKSASRIAVIDLHTGLGPYGHGEVINDHTPGSAGFKLAAQWYGANAQAVLLGESCSSPKHGLLDFYWHQLIAERGCFVTLEFGTYSLEGLIAVSYEEQRYHLSHRQAQTARSLKAPAVIALRDFFYPQDDTWRALVLFRADQIIQLALHGMRT